MSHIEAFFHTDCPNCGAPVSMYSPTAITVVCDYCHSMLVYRDGGIQDTGLDSALLQDFSPLQIGTTGYYQGQNFVLIGRLQVHYDAGMWNEWYVRFTDGSTGWLAESGDLYVFTRATHSFDNVPEFTEVQAGKSIIVYQGQNFIASDVRDIILDAMAAQGELPFVLTEKMHNQVVDWRFREQFLTLDYGQMPPLVFVGEMVVLQDLALQNIRSEEQIIESSGKLHGQRQSQNCPNCGANIFWQVGLTPTVICTSCGSDLDTSGETAKLIEAKQLRRQQSWYLPIGTKGILNGREVIVIGAVRRKNQQDKYYWDEYLLFNLQDGFHWLVFLHEDNQWFVSKTLNKFPDLNQFGEPKYLRLKEKYYAVVDYAAGAFYWHIRHGDSVYYRDYVDADDNVTLCAELSANELAWSQSQSISTQKIVNAFNLQDNKILSNNSNIPKRWSTIAIIIYVILNLPVWLILILNDNIILMCISTILGLIWVPTLLRKIGNNEKFFDNIDF